MTFEERMRLKQRSGFDKINTKEDVLLRKEQAQKLAAKPATKNKKMPKERYSKLPVSTIRSLNLESLGGKQTHATRDPRFDNLSGKMNEGLFRESYSFVKDLRSERIAQLKELVT